MRNRCSLVAGALLVAASGCAAHRNTGHADLRSRNSLAAEPIPPAAPGRSTSSESSSTSQSRSDDLARLRALADERRDVDRGDAYTLGPGDLVSITVFDLQDMSRTVRVSQRGEIQLPLIGTVRAAGRSEAALARDIASRLGGQYLQDPQVDVFVEEHRSQQVAVTGAVARPGLIPLTRDRDTILDMLSEAGGLTRDAGSFIEFIPGSAAGQSSPFDSARASMSGENLAGRGIQIEVSDLMRGATRGLDLPVLAGDVIFVPESGSFSLDGWVDVPGTYPLSRGMTVLGALSAGGGPLFPAALSRVQLLRTSSVGGEAREVIELDLDAIKEGRQQDVQLRSGDVVRVPANPFLVPLWAVYSLVKDLINIGAGVPIS